MQVNDVRNPAERNKLILAGGLGIVAILFLWWTFFGFGGSSNQPTARPAGQPTPSAVGKRPTTVAPARADAEVKADVETLKPIPASFPPVAAPEPKRNIFAYYEPPKPPVVVPSVPTATPTPVPPVLLASLSPANVYARTADFTLEVSGDKFTPQMRVVVDNNELKTRYINPQQLSATVPAAVIANPGGRQVIIRSADGKFYSNTHSISVAAPPIPNYSYVGILGTIRRNDTAILLDKSNKDTINVQRGDLLGGKFRVTSISDREVVVVDSTLKIKHTLTMTAQGDTKGNPLQRPTPRVESEDDEP